MIIMKEGDTVLARGGGATSEARRDMIGSVRRKTEATGLRMQETAGGSKSIDNEIVMVTK